MRTHRKCEMELEESIFMKKSHVFKALSAFLLAATITGTFVPVFAAGEDTQKGSNGVDLTSVTPAADDSAVGESTRGSNGLGERTAAEIMTLVDTDSYMNYSERNASKPKAKQTVVIQGSDYDAESTTAAVEVYSDYEGRSNCLYTPETETVTWKFTVPETGKYAIKLNYYTVKATNTTVERMLFIDGKLPFSETRYLYFPRTWEYDYVYDDDGNRTFDHDMNGNDIRPVRNEVFQWREYYLRDWVGFTMEPFEFYLEAGEHELTFEANREPMIIDTITIYPYIEASDYNEVAQGWVNDGLKLVHLDEPIKVQAEQPTTISMQSMFPANDRTSALTEPQDPSRIRYNVLDYANCNMFATYKVTVPEDGLYRIAVRYRQNALIGMFSSRRIYINDEVQFSEAERIRFVYNTGFQSEVLGNEERDFVFHFNKGENTVTFEAVLGDMIEYVYKIRGMVDELYEAYQLLLMITGPNPDANRDYGFSRIAGSAILTIAKASKELYAIVDELVAITGEKGDQVNTLETAALLFKQMSQDEYKIAGNFVSFKNYIVMLSNWMYTSLSQPIKLDYFEILGDEGVAPQAVASFNQSAWFEVKAFVMSFFMDYTTIGFKAESDDEVYDDYITMWATSDRETMLINRRIIDSNFTPQYNIGLTIKVINAGLEQAILAGIGPDISDMTTTNAITWGLRTAVEKLNDTNDPSVGFEGFDEACEDIDPAALKTCTLYGVTYALPKTMDFPMMFYRLDILAELGLEIPETWDELYDMMSVLQNKKLEVGLPVGLPGLQVFLYQQGIDLYTDDGWRTNLDSHEALSAFDTYAGFFRKYSSPVAWDTSRFRTGEIPVMMSSNGAAATANQSAVSFYNELMNYVELRGLWEIAPMLATVVENDDGTLSQNWSSVVLVTGMIIPRGSNNPESSWKYLKWYVSSDTQERMRNETIAVSPLPTTKYNTANTKVFLNQPWTASEYAAVSKQMKQLCGITEYPGHYIVPTYVKNAFMDVYNSGADASNAMLDRIYDINREISRKRQEFGMDAYDISYSGVDYTKKTGSETTDGE